MLDKLNSFHANLAANGKRAKDWSNSWTEHEYLGVDEEGRHKFAASLSMGHRVFKDKEDGQWKKRKLTDNRPDHVVVQGPQCCVEVHPYYAKFFDVHHTEVRVEEERWVVQRLFKEPDTWRDLGAYNPVMALEEYSEIAGEVIKVTMAYDTDYGPLTVEYIQRDGKALKHNITFTNNSGATEKFRVLQRWTGIAGSKVRARRKDHTITGKTLLRETNLVFEDAEGTFRIGENTESMRIESYKDIREMLGSADIPDRDFFRFPRMIRAVDECPSGARTFIGGLGLGLVLLALAHHRKANEIIVCEKDPTNVSEFASPILNYFADKYPGISLQIIQGDVAVEVTKHGSFDWILMDLHHEDYTEDELMALSIPYLTEDGKYTCGESSALDGSAILYLEPVEFDVHPKGLKADFIYSHWTLADGDSLIIDPDSTSLSNPNIDGDVSKGNTSQAACIGAALTSETGNTTVEWGGFWWLGHYWAHRGFIEWNITSLALATVTDTVFKYEGQATGARDGEINPFTEEAPTGATTQERWDDAATGVAYVDPFSVTVGATQSQDLGAACDTDLQTAIDASQAWFALGFVSVSDECPADAGLWYDSIYSEEKAGPAANPPPTLYVEYTAPAAFEPGHLKMLQGLGRMGYDLKTRGGKARRRVG